MLEGKTLCLIIAPHVIFLFFIMKSLTVACVIVYIKSARCRQSVHSGPHEFFFYCVGVPPTAQRRLTEGIELDSKLIQSPTGPIRKPTARTSLWTTDTDQGTIVLDVQCGSGQELELGVVAADGERGGPVSNNLDVSAVAGSALSQLMVRWMKGLTGEVEWRTGIGKLVSR